MFIEFFVFVYGVPTVQKYNALHFITTYIKFHVETYQTPISFADQII